jgi:uncharacterized protein
MQELHAALIALQEMDAEIARAEKRVQEFSPRLEALEAPVRTAEREMSATQSKLDEFRIEQKRLENAVDRNRDRLNAYQEKMYKLRGTRDEAAVRAEMDLVRRAADADAVDLKSASELATRTDLKVDDLIRNLDKLQNEIKAEADELHAGRAAAEAEVLELRAKRENLAVRLDEPSRRLYERLRMGRRKMVLAPLTPEGACGSCFNILPVQEQVQVRQGKSLHRCEGCGVILYAE